MPTLTANLSSLPAPNDAVFVTNSSRTAGTLTWTPQNAGGPYTVTFSASNAKNGVASTAVSVSNSDLAPVVTAPASAPATENAPFTLTVDVSDPDGQPINALTADLSGLPAGNNATFTVNAAKTQGTLAGKPTYFDAPGPYNRSAEHTT